MSIYKIPLPLNILEAARAYYWTLNTLPRVCVSFSGGKDSGLMLHLTAELARQMGKKNLRFVYRLGGAILLHH